MRLNITNLFSVCKSFTIGCPPTFCFEINLFRQHTKLGQVWRQLGFFTRKILHKIKVSLFLTVLIRLLLILLISKLTIRLFRFQLIMQNFYIFFQAFYSRFNNFLLRYVLIKYLLMFWLIWIIKKEIWCLTF